jgi:hypothetical protein
MTLRNGLSTFLDKKVDLALFLPPYPSNRRRTALCTLSLTVCRALRLGTMLRPQNCDWHVGNAFDDGESLG